ncbi:unnamed protein product [Amoebophrya sp. A25]|nr:unnamed protein product [Amoebophrya sp. A25]|eukprot:GSA25T00014052001.1
MSKSQVKQYVDNIASQDVPELADCTVQVDEQILSVRVEIMKLVVGRFKAIRKRAKKELAQHLQRKPDSTGSSSGRGDAIAEEVADADSDLLAQEQEERQTIMEKLESVEQHLTQANDRLRQTYARAKKCNEQAFGRGEQSKKTAKSNSKR